MVINGTSLFQVNRLNLLCDDANQVSPAEEVSLNET